MKKAIFVLLSIILCALQYSITWRFGIGWHNYGLIICSIVILSVFDLKLGMITGGVCGFLADCIQGNLFGLNIVIFLLTALFVNFVSRSMNGKSLLAVIILTFFVTFLTEFLQYWVYIIINGNGNISFALTKLIFPQAFINAFCVIPVYWLIKFLWKKLKMQNDRWDY